MIYLVGWLYIWGIALTIREFDNKEIWAFIISLLWPIVIPAGIIYCGITGEKL